MQTIAMQTAASEENSSDANNMLKFSLGSSFQARVHHGGIQQQHSTNRIFPSGK
jgi:hypothetical protein